MTLLESLEKQFDLLNHESMSELVALDLTGEKSKSLAHGWADNAQEALDWIDQVEFDWPHASLYIGVADRACTTQIGTRAKREDIEAVTCIVLDIDPERANGSRQMATKDERWAAGWAASAINMYLITHGFYGGVKLDSGNGIALYLPIERILVNDEPELDRKIATFMEMLRPVIADYKAKIDSTFDLPRLTRLAGSVNRKGPDQSLWRESRWL